MDKMETVEKKGRGGKGKKNLNHQIVREKQELLIVWKEYAEFHRNYFQT